MHALASLLPRDAVVVDESATSLPFVLRSMPFADTGLVLWLEDRHASAGVMGAAIGVQIAYPGRKVVATNWRRLRDVCPSGALDRGPVPAADHLHRAEQHLYPS